jgi:prevent-host-death family protein
MNIVGLREAKTKLTAIGRKAQKGGPALVTRRGRPFFVVVGVEGDDLMDVLVRWDPEFWKDLDARRKRSKRRSVSLEEFELSQPKRKRKR